MLIGLDIETTGLSLKQACIVSIALAEDFVSASKPSVAFYPNPSLPALRQLLQPGACVGWNTTFDLAWLMKLKAVQPSNAYTWHDARLAFRFAYPNAPGYGLGDVVDYLSGKPEAANEFAAYKNYKAETQHAIKDAAALYRDSPEAFRRRNELDALLALKIYRHCSTRLNPALKSLLGYYEASILPMTQAYVDGISLDTSKLHALDAELDVVIKTALAELGISDSKLARSRAWLTDKYKDELHLLPLSEKSKLPSFSKKHISKLNSLPLLKLRNALAMQDKFCKPYRNQQGIVTVHNQPLLYGTYTGRVTYSKGQDGIPLQQWARPVRSALSASDATNDYVWVEFDFAGQEMRIMASCAEAVRLYYTPSTAMANMCSLFNAEADLHTEMGSKLARMFLQFTPGELRFLGKQLNLAAQYRMGASTLVTRFLQDGIVLTVEQAQALLNAYHAAYPEVRVYWNYALQHTRATTMYGRWIDTGNEYSDEQTRINFPIQGTGADMKYICVAYMAAHYPQFRFLLDMHDGMHYRILKADYSAELCLTAANEMAALFSNQRFHCPMPIEVKVGTNWGNLKTIKQETLK